MTAARARSVNMLLSMLAAVFAVVGGFIWCVIHRPHVALIIGAIAVGFIAWIVLVAVGVVLNGDE
jgi:hypothetical protein